MSSYRIAVLAGDGIGKEVMPEGIRVLDAVARKHQLNLTFDHFDFASCDYYLEHGQMMLVTAKNEDWSGLAALTTTWQRMLKDFFARSDAKDLPNAQLEIEKISQIQRELIKLVHKESDMLNTQTALFNRSRRACRIYSK